jgi:aspartate racemase
MKKIGLLGGVSHFTTLEYYSRIMDLYALQYGDLNYPEMVIYSLSHGPFKLYEDTNQIEKYVNYIASGVENLLAAGAEVIALAANSPHRVLPQLQDRFQVPFINALDSAYHAAQNQGIKKGLLLGIKFTMQASFYQERFSRGGIELITPALAEQDEINQIIFKKLINGKPIDEESRQQILGIIANHPADGVILGCMRLPVFFNQQTAPGINLVNALECHINDILNAAEGS